MGDIELTRQVIGRLDEWVNHLGAPLLPLRAVRDPDGGFRIEFREATAQAVVIGKLVRAVSGIRAALLLVDAGFVAESASLLRMVSDFCTEVDPVTEGLRSGKRVSAIERFVEQYFIPRARTPDEYQAAEKTFYVSRDELLKAQVRMTERTGIDGQELRKLKRFLNMGFDAYVHGSYETATELFNPETGLFQMSGHPSPAKRSEFYDAVAGKLHEVVVAIELAAVALGDPLVHYQARGARRELDAAEGQGH